MTSPSIDWELTIEDCVTLQHHYSNIMADTELLAKLAGARQFSIEMAYHECKKANVILGNRIKYLQSKGQK